MDVPRGDRGRAIQLRGVCGENEGEGGGLLISEEIPKGADVWGMEETGPGKGQTVRGKKAAAKYRK